MKPKLTNLPGKKLTIGLVLNPVAGVGGPAALKGSDGAGLYQLATELGYESKVADRVSRTFETLITCIHDFRVVTVPGAMGADLCKKIAAVQPDFDFKVCVDFGLRGGFEADIVKDVEIHHDATTGQFTTTATHTIEAVRQLVNTGVDIVLFAGGDGTARNVHDALETESRQLVLGIPCGVKMHSGVFAVSPEAAGIVIQQLIEGELVGVTAREVRDIDEEALRAGTVNARYYGEMWVPEQHRYIQAVKQGGLEVEELVLEEIASEVVEQIEQGGIYIIGAGTTTASIMDKLGLPNTLLGIDVIDDGELVLSDAAEDNLFSYLSERKLAATAETSITKLLLTPIGGQGHLFGRGNQQISPRIIQLIGRENILVVATKSKLENLGHPDATELKGIRLLVDTGDRTLDESLCGLIPVVTGYEDAVICRLALD